MNGSNDPGWQGPPPPRPPARQPSAGDGDDERTREQPAWSSPAWSQPTAGQAWSDPSQGQPAWGQPAQGPPAHAQPAQGQPAWGQPAQGQPAWGQQWQPAPAPRRGAPIWVVVLVGVLALLLGLGIGGTIGFFVGMGAQVAEDFMAPEIGPDAQRVEGPLAGVHQLGDLTVSGLTVVSDFADDFEVSATVTNGGGGTYEGGAMQVRLLRGGEQLGSVSGVVPPLQPGESQTVTLWGFDDYQDGVDRVEVLVD